MPSDPIIQYDYTLAAQPEYRAVMDQAAEGRRTGHELTLSIDGHEVQSPVHAVYNMLDYERHGRQAFVVGPRLQEMFSHTSLDGIERSELRFPYPIFYVALPDTGWKIWGGPTGWHTITGMYVREFPDQISFFLWGRENEHSIEIGDDANYWFHLDMKAAFAAGLENYLVSMLSDPDNDASDFDIESTPMRPGVARLSRLEVIKQTLPSVVGALRTALNLIVYLQSERPDLSRDARNAAERARRAELTKMLGQKKNPNKKSSRHLQREIDRLSESTVTWLGKRIEDEYEAKERAGAGGTHGSPRRHWVRGHYKRTSRSMRTWIQPYQRGGTESEPATGRTYRLPETP